MEGAEAGGWEDRPADERCYVQLSPESVINAAESIGISGLSPAAAKALAEDATYRLREIADLCSQFLRHSRKRKLTTTVFNRALKCKSVPPVIGYKRPQGCPDAGLEVTFVPEAEVFVTGDLEVNLVTEALQASGPHADLCLGVSASWLALQGKVSRKLPFTPIKFKRSVPGKALVFFLQLFLYSGMPMPVITEENKIVPPLVPPQSCLRYKIVPPLVPPQSCLRYKIVTVKFFSDTTLAPIYFFFFTCSPALLQYYTVLTRHVLGDSEQLCRIVLQVRTSSIS
jgi:hypothetical protein